MRLSFEGCVFDSDTRQVSRDGRIVALSPKAFALLEILIRERPKAVSREGIHEELWPATFVSEANLANLIVELRAAVGDDARRSRVIRTVARFGYAFCAEATAAEPAGRAAPHPTPPAYRLIWGRREIALHSGENLIGRDQEAVGVAFVGINSGTLETIEEVRAHARDHGHTFDIIKDPDSRVAELLDARRTPEVFLLDSSGTLRYHGRIASKISSPDLRSAIDALLEGKPIHPAETKAFGCAISRH